MATVAYTFSAAGTYPVTASFTSDGVYNDATTTLSLVVKTKTTGRLT